MRRPTRRSAMSSRPRPDPVEPATGASFAPAPFGPAPFGPAPFGLVPFAPDSFADGETGR